MPTPGREVRAVVALVLATLMLLPGGALRAGAVTELALAYAPVSVAAALPLVSLVLAVVVAALALSATRSGTADVWHHLASAAFWLAALQAVLAVLAFLAVAAGFSPYSM